MIRRTPTLLAPTLLGLATTLLLTACGGDSGGEAAATSSSSAACTSSPATADAPASVSTDLTQAPEVPAADGPPPCGLVISDVVVGDGATAVAGAPVEVKYVGAFYDTGSPSTPRGAGVTTRRCRSPRAPGRSSPGSTPGSPAWPWGCWYVVIPSDLGYGPSGQGPIPPDATLVFVVDLVSVG